MSPDGKLTVVVCVRPPSDYVVERGGRALGELDLRAVDYAVGLGRRSDAPVRVAAVAAGGAPARAALRECVAIGADDALHVLTDDDVSVDGLAVARLLAPVVARFKPDLVLCGTCSDVGMHGTVPPAIAHALGLPFVGSVVELDLDLRSSKPAARAVQLLERGDRWAWGCDLPMVCAVERDLSMPRYLSVARLRRAADAAPETHQAVNDVAAGDGEIGRLVVESRNQPRIRPKKAAAPSAAMSPADRMKFLRGGSATATASDSDSDSEHRRVSDDPARAAAEIMKLLEKHELLR